LKDNGSNGEEKPCTIGGKMMNDELAPISGKYDEFVRRVLLRRLLGG
jgi:hypothetical protein